MRKTLLAITALIPLAACASTINDTKDALLGPQLAPVGYPSQLAPSTQTFVDVRQEPPQAGSANSLWRTGARAFFNDQRAGRIGDILTVNIDTDVGRAHVKPHSPDAQFVSDPQFRLFRDGSRWMVAHAPGAQNQTLVDGQPLSTPVALIS